MPEAFRILQGFKHKLITRAQVAGYEEFCSRALVGVCVEYLFFALPLLSE
jgi:hypothetical protein